MIETMKMAEGFNSSFNSLIKKIQWGSKSDDQGTP